MQETRNLQTPDIFRLWGGISTVSAALQRNVWIETDSGFIFPNTYVFLVAPPGVGKGVMLKRLKSYLAPIDSIHFGRSDMTRASFVDELELGHVLGDPLRKVEDYYSLTVIVQELGTILSEYALDFMSVLTDLYDSGEYSEKKRASAGGKDAIMDRVQVNILAGTQPGFLQNFIPDIAWEQGFLSRVMLIYAESAPPVPLFSGKKGRDNKKWLAPAMQDIAKLRGEFKITKDAVNHLEHWNVEGRKETDPNHPKLTHYNSRRVVHYIKLCMIAAASTGSLTIDMATCERALGWLTNAEDNMVGGLQDISNTARSADDTATELYEFILKEYDGTNVVPKKKVYAFLQARMRPYEIDKFLQVMQQAGFLKAVGAGFKPDVPG